VAVTITRTNRSAFMFCLLFRNGFLRRALSRHAKLVVVCVGALFFSQSQVKVRKEFTPSKGFCGDITPVQRSSRGDGCRASHVAKVRSEDNCPPLVPPKSKRDQSTDRRLRESHRGRLHRGQRPKTHRICDVTKDLVSTATRPPNTQFCSPSLLSGSFLPSLSPSPPSSARLHTSTMAKNPLFGILWLVLLFFIAWPVAGFCAGIWVLLQVRSLRLQPSVQEVEGALQEDRLQSVLLSVGCFCGAVSTHLSQILLCRFYPLTPTTCLESTALRGALWIRQANHHLPGEDHHVVRVLCPFGCFGLDPAKGRVDC
jgi:hypothetical protein